VTAHRPFMGDDLRNSTAWHAQFEDVNNDGLTDLFVAKGNVAEMPDFAAKDPNNLLLGQADGKFMEVADKAGVASTEISRGAMITDFNLDGALDLVVVNRNSPAQLWRNTSAKAGHWVAFKLEQAGPNRDGIGAWIETKRGDVITRREITSGGGHASGQLGWWHFGLGTADTAEVRVLWPDGFIGPWQSVQSNGFYRLTHEQAPQRWTPGR
jgi:enediyne biosynthesis protein E4